MEASLKQHPVTEFSRVGRILCLQTKICTNADI